MNAIEQIVNANKQRSKELLAYYASELNRLSEREITRMLKESNDELEKVTKENERLTAENASYAQVLEGCMEAQDTKQESNRVAAIEVANEWNADTSPFQTEPQQSFASSPRRKRTRASSYQKEQEQMGSACPTLMCSSRGRRTTTTTTTTIWDQEVRLT